MYDSAVFAGVLIDVPSNGDSRQVGSLYGQFETNSENEEELSDSEEESSEEAESSTDDEEDENNTVSYDRQQLLNLSDDENEAENGNSQAAEHLPETRETVMNKTRGISPLFLAIKENHTGCVKTLLRSGCNLDILAEITQGQYVGPFEYALVRGYVSSARMLLSCGVTKNNMNAALLSMAFDVLLTRQGSQPQGAFNSAEPSADGSSELVDWVLEQIQGPPSLMVLSRRVVRSAMGRRVLGSIHELQLPSRLSDFVALKDLDDFES